MTPTDDVAALRQELARLQAENDALRMLNLELLVRGTDTASRYEAGLRAGAHMMRDYFAGQGGARG